MTGSLLDKHSLDHLTYIFRVFPHRRAAKLLHNPSSRKMLLGRVRYPLRLVCESVHCEGWEEGEVVFTIPQLVILGKTEDVKSERIGRVISLGYMLCKNARDC